MTPEDRDYGTGDHELSQVTSLVEAGERIPFYRSLGFRISLRLLLLSLPLLASAAWLVSLGERGFAEQSTLDRGRVAALSGAAAYGQILEDALRDQTWWRPAPGRITLDQLVNPIYRQISYPFPVAGKRFHTAYDWYTDSHGVRELQDAILGSSSEFIYASGIDLRGYVPTPHGRYACEPNGDPQHDLQCRAKRKYDEPEQLAAAGYVGDQPTLVQDYHRDTGELIWDVAAPIFVQGEHWGAFRVGVVRARAALHARDLAWAMARVLLGALVLLALANVLLVRRSLRPLVELTSTAFCMSTATEAAELHKPIRAAARDEIGSLAKTLNRLRLSILATWGRV